MVGGGLNMIVNLPEMKAFLLVLSASEDKIMDHGLVLMTDNLPTVSYLNSQRAWFLNLVSTSL